MSDLEASIGRLDDFVQQRQSTLQSVLGFVASHATERDIEQILEAAQTRRKVLAQVRSAALSVGTKVTLGGLRPKYLNDLSGTVRIINGQRCDVSLDEASTNRLRYAGKRFIVRPDVTSYVLKGVPVTCARP